MPKLVLVSIFFLFSILTSGCSDSMNSGQEPQEKNPVVSVLPEENSTNSIEFDPRKFSIDALLYYGPGAAEPDVAAIEKILKDHGVSYSVVNAVQLNAMSIDDIANHGTIIWPGGYAGIASKSLEPATRTRVRQAVRERGVSYVGFCAGAFIAYNPAPKDGADPEYGFSILDYPSILPEYEPDGTHQHDFPMELEFSMANGTKQDIVWWGGPFFPAAREVLARYKDGSNAMMQARAENGFVVLSGPHPESPAEWVKEAYDKDGVDIDITLAWQLIEAALKRTPLPTF